MVARDFAVCIGGIGQFPQKENYGFSPRVSFLLSSVCNRVRIHSSVTVRASMLALAKTLAGVSGRREKNRNLPGDT